MSGYFGENLFFPEFLGLKSYIMPPSSLVLEINWKREEIREGRGRGNPESMNAPSCVVLLLHSGTRRKSSGISFAGAQVCA